MKHLVTFVITSLIAFAAIAIFPQNLFAQADEFEEDENEEYEYNEYDSDTSGIADLCPEQFGKGLPFIFDQAGLLTADEREFLNEKANSISQNYSCNVHIVIVDDFTNFSDSYDIETFSEEICSGYNLGYGVNHDVLLLVMSMAERDYDFYRYGSLANKAVDSYTSNKITSGFLDNFRENDWYGGFYDYLSLCERFLVKATTGQIDDPNFKMGSLLISMLLGLIVSLVSMFGVKKASSHKPKEKNEAENYIANNGIQFTYRQDRFSHTTEVRTYSPRQSSSSSSGGGRSHSSGKF